MAKAKKGPISQAAARKAGLDATKAGRKGGRTGVMLGVEKKTGKGKGAKSVITGGGGG